MSNVLVTKGIVHSSVFAKAVDVKPPKTTALIPPNVEPCILYLAVAKSASSVQLVPFQFSFKAELPGFILPPVANANVDVPFPVKVSLAVFKFPTSVQAVPFQSSVFAVWWCTSSHN